MMPPDLEDQYKAVLSMWRAIQESLDAFHVTTDEGLVVLIAAISDMAAREMQKRKAH